MPDAKEEHYWTQVQAALTAGDWTSHSPAKTPYGAFVSWSELFRKAKKHGKQSDVIEAASQAHFLSLLLDTTRRSSGLLKEKDKEKSDVFELGDECVVREERREDVQKAFEGLQQLNSPGEYAKQVTAFFAYALGRPTECLEIVSSISFASSLKAAHPTLVVTSDDQRATTSTNFAPVSPTEVRGGDVWTLMEALRTVCLEGMAHEKISTGSPSQALAAYDKGIHLLRSYTISKSQLPRSGHGNFETFRQYRELWNWTERVLWRAIALSSQHRNLDQTLTFLRTYMLHSSHWPPTFQAEHRATICSLYLRALILLTPHSKEFSTKLEWMSEARGVVHENRAILDATTKFPSAGERNELVEDFVDVCVALWETGGAVGDQAAWVIDVLWWATRLTFNSPRILRHMFRLLHVSGDNDLAKRVLRLYVQVVKKARETGTVDLHGNDTHDASAMELDTLWVQTLVQGARMLCRVPKDVEDVREAESLINLARQSVSKLGDEVIASVDLAEGIFKSVLALEENNPDTRGTLLSASIFLLSRSVERHPTPSSLFHLALCLSRSIPERDLNRAVDFCRRAVEGDSNEVRYWHLLSLLLAKQREWKKAKGVIDAAIEIAHDVETHMQAEELSSDGVASKDFAEPINQNASIEENAGRENGCRQPVGALVDSETKIILPAATLLKRIPDHPPASQRDLFEHIFQLRMTQIVITELTEGPDSVEACWLEVFEWYSQRRDIDAQTVSLRPSVETRRTPSPLADHLSTHLSPQQQEGVESSSEVSSSTNGQLAPEDSVDAVTIRQAHGGSSEGISQSSSTSDDARPSESQPQAEVTEDRRRSVESQRSEGRGKRMQQILKNQVHKQQVRISSMSRKLGHGSSRSSAEIRRSTSTPDLQAALARAGPYQASSIHSRRRLSFSSRLLRTAHSAADYNNSSPPPPPLPSLPPLSTSSGRGAIGGHIRNARERRLLSDLWLMSAATFRRLEKLDQVRGAIQEAELLDEENEGVWIQLGLYFIARNEDEKAIEAFNKALFISQDSIPATIHLAKLYLTSTSPRLCAKEYGALPLGIGMLEELTRGVGWDVAEAWYLLAKGYGMQERKERQRECLLFALGLSEVRGVRGLREAIGLCL